MDLRYSETSDKVAKLLSQYGLPIVKSAKNSRKECDVELNVLYQDMTYEFKFETFEYEKIRKRIMTLAYLKNNHKISYMNNKQMMCLISIWLIKIACQNKLFTYDHRVRKLARKICAKNEGALASINEIGTKVKDCRNKLKDLEEFITIKKEYGVEDVSALIMQIEKLLVNKTEISKEIKLRSAQLKKYNHQFEIDQDEKTQEKLIWVQKRLLNLTNNFRNLGNCEKHLIILKKFESTSDTEDELHEKFRMIEKAERIIIFMILLRTFNENALIFPKIN